MNQTTTDFANDSSSGDIGDAFGELEVAVVPLETLIYKPLLVGLVATLLSFLFLGCGIHWGWNENLTPRIANRPKNMLRNAMLQRLPEYTKRSPLWYPIAWMWWAYEFTYAEGLMGIPGTGTRMDGREGPRLRINLDEVILLRFQTLVFKVTVLVAFLCCFIVLPVNMTAGCDETIFGAGTCAARKVNSSMFKSTTIANIPDKIFNKNQNDTSGGCSISSGDLLFFINNRNGTYQNPCDNLADDFWLEGQTPRIMATMISCLITYAYILYLVTCEWVENVTLRRKYYLEASHHTNRMSELEKLALERQNRMSELEKLALERHKWEDLEVVPEIPRDGSKGLSESTSGLVDHRLRSVTYADRPEWLAHPEIRETPPCIGIFSVLYQLPKSLVTFGTDEATTLERQLVATTSFFNEIIRPDEGFSSSVAAVTVIPNATLVEKARSRWKDCEKKLQKLRYIRKIKQRRKEEQKIYEERELERRAKHAPMFVPEEDEHDDSGVVEIPDRVFGFDEGGSDPEFADDVEIVMSTSNADSLIVDLSSGNRSMVANYTKTLRRTPFEFKYECFDIKEYASSVGLHEEVHDISDFVHGMGIEEFNVFARECADLAGQPSFDRKVYDMYALESLREEEKELVKELREASSELEKAREEVVKFQDDTKLDATASILQPSTRLEVEDDGILRTLDSPLRHAERIRRRTTISTKRRQHGDGNPNDKTRTGEAAANNRDEKKRKDDDDDRGCLGCLAEIPGRVYRGKKDEAVAGDRRSRERRKYYGSVKDFGGKGDNQDAFVTDLRYPSYAVITFTSRQAAVIARQCLADGGARNSWKQADDIPVYPLAEAPPTYVWKPVTPTISYASKKLRRWIIYTFITLFTIFNVYIVTLINEFIVEPLFIDPIGGFGEIGAPLAASASGLTQSVLFSCGPTIFKMLAGIEGSSMSYQKVEQKAMIFFWYFYIVARFMGPIVWNMIESFTKGDLLAEEVISEGFTQLAKTVPTVLGPSALTYIIFSFSVTWPVVYLCQAPNFATNFVCLNWLNRLLKEGGSGAKVSLSIYVNGGYIFACTVALAPLCPLIAPFSLMQSIVVAPILRWLLVFVYRPKHNGGGDKWPQIHHMIITTIMLGQVITGCTFILKRNNIEGAVMIFSMVPTLLYNRIVLEKFRRPFRDAALLQSSRMYSHAKNAGSDARTWLEREEYRRWLVDCHKACYVPACMSGDDKSLLTAEPAIVISEADNAAAAADSNKMGSMMRNDDDDDGGRDFLLPTTGRRSSFQNPEQNAEFQKSMRRVMKKQKAQKGGILRRQMFNI